MSKQRHIWLTAAGVNRRWQIYEQILAHKNVGSYLVQELVTRLLAMFLESNLFCDIDQWTASMPYSYALAN